MQDIRNHKQSASFGVIEDDHWNKDPKALVELRNDRRKVKAPTRVGMNASTAGSNRSIGINRLRRKGKYEWNFDSDGATTVTDEELQRSGSICSPTSDFCSEHATNETQHSNIPADCCIDDHSGGTNTTERSTEHFMSTIEDVDSLLEHISDLLDREKIHRNASKLLVDLVPIQPSQMSSKSSSRNLNSFSEKPPFRIESVYTDSTQQDAKCKERKAYRTPLGGEENRETPFQIAQRPCRGLGLRNLPNQRKSDESMVSIFADRSVVSDDSSSEHPHDSVEPADLATGGSLFRKIEKDFQPIFNGDRYRSSHKKTSDPFACTNSLSAERERSKIPIDTHEANITRDLNIAQPLYRRACSLLKLGTQQMNSGRVDAAIGSFALSVKEFRAMKRKEVALARAVNLLGIAYKSKKNWGRAIDCFREAFSIRHRELGKCHVDTIDSLNHLGSALLHSGDIKCAQKTFWEAFWARKAIFGSIHPGVAIAAHDLANVLSALRNFSEAKKFYLTAWVIYHEMSLHKSHPSLVRLVLDIENVKDMTRRVKAEV